MEPNQNIINLESLLDLSARLNDSDNEEFILNSVLLSLMGKLKILRSGILIPKEDCLEVFITKGAVASKTISTVNAVKIASFTVLLADNPEHKELYELGFRYCLPICNKSELLAIICLGSRFTLEDLDPSETRYAQLVATIASNAVKNARSHKSLLIQKNKTESRNQLLMTLFELSSDFNGLNSREQILKMLSLNLMGQLMVSRFAVLLEAAYGKFELIINRFDDRGESKHINIEPQFTSIVRFGSDEFPKDFRKHFPSAELVSPMIVHGKTRGLLVMGKSMSNAEFTELNLLFLTALGNIAISALENERLFKEEIEKKRIESELLLALDIQKNLLPRETPNMPGFDIAGISVPSRHVGGDYFDYIKLDNHRTLIAIGDVSGKGLPASLLMANVQAALKVLTPFSLTLEELIEKLNKIVFENTASDKFVTFFCGILDSSNRNFTYINAGHNPPYHLSDGKLTRLTEGGLILGCLEEPMPYTSGEVTVKANDCILMFTDGVTEAFDSDYNEFSEERLEQILIAHSTKPAEIIKQTIISEINDFSGPNNQTDDITLVLIKGE